jgi:hypothetical protein
MKENDTTHDRMFVFADNHKKKYLIELRLFPDFKRDRVDTCNVHDEVSQARQF